MADKEQESLHWADQIAREVKQRVEEDPVLQKIVAEKGYIVYDEKTPSGKIHIGSGRGWIIHDAITKAMRSLGLKARFILSSDDIDPFDKMNADLPPDFKKYLGMPFRNIPSPVEGFKSFADYYFQDAIKKFPEFGIECDFESTGERYDKGDFNWAIKKVLNSDEKISKIYERFYGEAPDKFFISPICDKCGKISTTHVDEWDEEQELVTYTCKVDGVKYTEGCGHKGQKSPYNGNAKLPWKVEWAAKWPTVGVMVEYAGKDHFTHGGSRTIAVAISNEVFDFPPPYPSTRHNIGKAYEFFTIGGQKMSTSKGKGISFSESTSYAPANILRYLLVATRPRAVIDFDPVTKNDLILLYERFDRTERAYFGKENIENPHELQKLKRIYELAHVGKVPASLPPQISFTHAAVVIQAMLDEDRAVEKLKETGHVPEDISAADLVYIKERLSFAKSWIESFAPERYKFSVQNVVSKHMKLSVDEKKGLKKVKEYLEAHDKIDEIELHNQFYEIAKAVKIDSQAFFKAAYRVLINKDRGPKLAGFMLTIGRKKVINLLGQVG